jgi:hypothetical protein
MFTQENNGMNTNHPQDGEFDPTADQIESLSFPVHNAMVGRTPSGFVKVRVEMKPQDLIKIIGYDPRGLQPIRKGNRVIEASKVVSQALVDLQKEVQRSIDSDKVAEMVDYLYAAVANDKFADWSELDVVTATAVDTSRFQAAHVILLPTAAEYFLVDGQHRYCAVIDFVRQYPDLASKFTQAVAISVIEPDKLREWAGQGFHDKNYLRTAVKATKALAVDSRDIHNVLTKALHQQETIIAGGGVNEEKDSLPASSTEMVTHAVLYKFVRGFCEGRRGLDRGRISNPNVTDETFAEYQHKLFDYVQDLGKALPAWTDPNPEVRAQYLFRSSPAWQALGVVGHLLKEIDDEDERKRLITMIGQLDWSRSNLSWESIIGAKQQEIDENTGRVTREWISPRSSRQPIDATIGFLKQRLGLNAAAIQNEAAEL